jgi:FAD/FMN-containing dehydrogenase
VTFANQKDLPFLAFNGAHGSITTLGAMDHGIEIYLNQLSSIEIAADGQTATFGGGVRAKNVTDTLWAAGKQTGALPCATRVFDANL